MRVIVLIFFLLPLKSVAALTCSQVFNDYTPSEKQTTTNIQIRSSEGLKADEINIARNTVNSINQLVGKAIKVPELVSLDIKKKGEDAEFDWDYKITFPHQYLINGKPKHPKFSQTILSHEYGHYIFSVNLREFFDNYAKFEYQARMTIIYAAEVRIASGLYEKAITQLAQARKENDLTKIAELKNNVENAEKIFDEASEKMDQMNDAVKTSEFSQISILSYHELFADIIAVLHLKDPQAMSSVLSSASTKGVSEKAAISSRNFLNRIRLNGWSQVEPHMLFAPTRRFIWDYVLSNPRHNQNPEILIKEILYCIEEEISNRITERSFDISSEEMNRRLIDRLMKSFP